ncbi:MAG: M56 family metallopeptidase [Phycisphaerae bacterium]|nr:M56 family metallopeptidase [Phycisphaerae bacterium]
MSNAVVSSLTDGSGWLVAWITRANLWTAALFVLTFAADRLLAKRVAPTWRMALYGAVLMRLMIPFDMSTPFGLLPSTSDVAPGNVPVTVLAAESAAPREVIPGHAVAPVAAWVWTAMVPLAYCCGVAVMLGRWRRDAARLWKIVCDSVPGAPSVAALSDDLVIREHATHGPLLIGLRTPVIVLPRGLVEALAPAALRDIVRHESAHVARRDPLCAGLLHLAVIIAWPITPVWWAGSRIRALMEIAADERALRGADTETRAANGRTLVDVASTARHMIGGGALAFTASISPQQPRSPSPVLCLHRGRARARRTSTSMARPMRPISHRCSAFGAPAKRRTTTNV